MKRLIISVSGRVQGVFFRAYTEKMAKSLSLTGFVCNLDDGRVKIIAEGDHKNLDELLAWCYKGSPLSKVEKVEFQYEEANNSFDSFTISSPP